MCSMEPSCAFCFFSGVKVYLQEVTSFFTWPYIYFIHSSEFFLINFTSNKQILCIFSNMLEVVYKSLSSTNTQTEELMIFFAWIRVFDLYCFITM